MLTDFVLCATMQMPGLEVCPEDVSTNRPLLTSTLRNLLIIGKDMTSLQSEVTPLNSAAAVTTVATEPPESVRRFIVVNMPTTEGSQAVTAQALLREVEAAGGVKFHGARLAI